MNGTTTRRTQLTRTVVVTAALGLLATTAAYVVVRNDVDRLDRRRIDRPATDALLGVQGLAASVDQVLATANGVVATSDLDARRFAEVLGPDVRHSPTLAGLALVADTPTGPSVEARVGDTHLLRDPRTVLVDSAASTLIASRQEGQAFELGFASLVAHDKRAVYLEVKMPAASGGVPFAIVDRSGRIVFGNVLGTASLSRWGQPVTFAGGTYALLVRAGPAPGAVLGLSLPLLVLLVGLLLTAIAVAVAVTIVRRNAAVRYLDVENRALDDALARQLAIEAELRASQGRFRTILRGTPDVIFLFDPSDGSCEVLNRTELLGHPLDAVAAPGGLASLVYADDQVAADTLWARVAELDEDDRVDESTLRLRDAIGELRYARLRFAPLGVVDPGGGLRMLGVLTDVTDARTVEIQQAELQDTLMRAQRLDAVGQLAGGVAHDFNNLLATILASAELLGDYVPDGRPREYTSEIERAATRGAALVRQLLTFAQRDHAEPQLVNLNEIVAGLEPLLRRTLGDHIQLQITTTDCSAEVVGDPTHVEQVILNLAVNARDAMPDGGVLWIATAIDFDDERPENDRVVLSVIDTGTGITPEIRDRMFDPFVTSKEPGKGTGLGLATVRSIVNEMQGAINVLTKAGEGTTFEVSLARRFGDVAAVAAEDRPEVLDGAGRHILLVEDDTAVRFALAHLLRRLDFTVTTSTNGAEALQFLEQQRYDLVLTDAVMPGLSGPELVRNLQRLRPELPVIMMSGYTSETLPEGAAAAGTQQLRKPFTNAELTRALRRAFEQPVVEQAPT